MGKIIEDFDNKSFREKRRQFQDYLGVRNWDPPLMLCEMKIIDGEVKSTKSEMYSGYFNEYWNTRNILLTELVIEFDSADFAINLDAIYGTCLNLIKAGFHFSVWYAMGMRSAHIRIYDFIDAGIEPSILRKVRELFSLKMVPIEYHSILDRHLFGNHKVCLEFSKHWKYNTAFELLFEHLPEVKDGPTKA